MSIHDCALIVVPKVSLMKSTVSVTYWSRLSRRSCAWVATNVPIAALKEITATNTPTIISAVAEPRLQPRAARRLTAGSIAKARNSEINKRMKKFESCLKISRVTRVAKNPSQNSKIARGTHLGIRCGGVGISDST